MGTIIGIFQYIPYLILPRWRSDAGDLDVKSLLRIIGQYITSYIAIYIHVVGLFTICR